MNDRLGQRRAILFNCVFLIPFLVNNNGFLVSLMDTLGISGERALAVLGLPSVVGAVVLIPAAYIGDRLGVRRMATLGLIIAACGTGLLCLSGWLVTPALIWPAVGLNALGHATLTAVWFTLIAGITIPETRGRFFGRMRLIFQALGVVVGLGVAWFLHGSADLRVYQTVLASFVVCGIASVVMFRRIPDHTVRDTGREPLWTACASLLPTPGYLPFGAYLFLQRIAIGAIPWVFALVQKNVLHFSASQVIVLANLMAVGTMAGFWLGGRLVDRHGSKPVFLLAHGGFALVALLVLGRDLLPMPTFAVFTLACFSWGAIDAASGIATTTEMMALAPTRNQSLAVSLLNTALSAGAALSAWAGSQAISVGLFRDGWLLFGHPMSAFDGLLAISCFLVITFTVTLGLVPAVMRRHQDLA